MTAGVQTSSGTHQTELDGVRAIAILFAVCLLFLACSREPRDAVQLLALGDSLTAGTGVSEADSFPQQLARRLRAQHVTVEVTTVARSGNTASQLNQWLRQARVPKPDLVTLCIGTNDVAHGGSLEEFAAEFGRTRAWLHDAGARPDRVLVLSLPDWSFLPGAERLGQPAALRIRFAEFNARLREESALAGFVLVDLQEPMKRAMTTGLVVEDGFHPSAAGYALWVDGLWPRVWERALESGWLRKGSSK